MNRPSDEADGPTAEGGCASADERLLADFLAGNEAAFTVLVERYSAELFQFVARFVGSSAAAEDVIQETFVQLYQSAKGFDPGRRLRPWLFTIAANKARDCLRIRVRRREVPLSGGAGPDGADEVSYLDFLADASATPAEEMQTHERQEVVRAIVADMPEALREVLVLGYYQRLAYKDMAEILGIPLGTVKSRLHAAVSYFATAYKKQEEERSGEPKAPRRSSSKRDHRT